MDDLVAWQPNVMPGGGHRTENHATSRNVDTRRIAANQIAGSIALSVGLISNAMPEATDSRLTAKRNSGHRVPATQTSLRTLAQIAIDNPDRTRMAMAGNLRVRGFAAEILRVWNR